MRIKEGLLQVGSCVQEVPLFHMSQNVNIDRYPELILEVVAIPRQIWRVSYLMVVCEDMLETLVAR